MNENLADIIKAIVWLIVFAIWFLVTLWKKVHQEKKKDKSSPPPPHKVLVREDSQDMQKDEKRPSPTRKIFGELRGELENFFQDIAKMQKGEEERLRQPAKTGKKIASVTHPPDIPADTVSEKIESFQTGTPELQKGVPRSPFRLKLSKKGLQQAVVYSEILGPPVALRENDRTF